MFYFNDHEVHLIDSPGFDDPEKTDAEVLEDIASMVNTIHQLEDSFAGLLYLHDISRSKMGGGGERNIRLLEGFLGKSSFENCTLVTTKWGTLRDPNVESTREEQLLSDQRYWKALRSGGSQASMTRFENNQASALEIIRPLLGNDFTPNISYEMVAAEGPKLSIGETEAGQLLGDSGERRLRAAGKEDEIARLKAVLQMKFNQEQFEKFSKERDALQAQINRKNIGRWALRLIVTGGCIMATVVTRDTKVASSMFTVGAIGWTKLFSTDEQDEKKMEALKEKYEIVSFDTVDVNAI